LDLSGHEICFILKIGCDLGGHEIRFNKPKESESIHDSATLVRMLILLPLVLLSPLPLFLADEGEEGAVPC